MSQRSENWLHGARNDRWIDLWSFVHLLTGIGLAWFLPPFWALALMIAWEPFEIFVLSPLVWRVLGIRFGYESLRNSFSDILFDVVGVALGAYVLKPWLG